MFDITSYSTSAREAFNVAKVDNSPPNFGTGLSKEASKRQVTSINGLSQVKSKSQRKTGYAVDSLHAVHPPEP